MNEREFQSVLAAGHAESLKQERIVARESKLVKMIKRCENVLRSVKKRYPKDVSFDSLMKDLKEMRKDNYE